MKKLLSLIKTSLNHDMEIFKINTKKKSKVVKVLVPLILTAYIMFLFGFYAEELIKQLAPVKLEYVVLSLFVLATSLFTLIEGIYKSSSLLFNCKDDDLLLSLPIKKSTVLFIRIFKFYVFELLFNTLFLLPVIGVYAYFVNPGISFYISSIIALLMLPIIPIIISCIFGFAIAFLSSRVKGKRIFQTIFTFLFIAAIVVVEYKMTPYFENIAAKATSLNEVITKIYYPAGLYTQLAIDFHFKDLIIFIISQLAIFVFGIVLLSRVYFRINSNVKRVLVNKHHKIKYSIKTGNPVKAIVKKEIKRFINTPVFIVNAGLGIVLYVAACIYAVVKYDSLVLNIVNNSPDLTIDMVNSSLPVLMFGLLAFSSLLTSITSSMISLEGKSFNILKTIPVKVPKIINAKVLAALVMMIPFYIIGDIVIFIKFNFSIVDMLLILIASFILPLVSSTIGILVNLKFPKMNASNDTEIVKQSMSSFVSVMIGLGLVGLTGILLFKLLDTNLSCSIIVLIFVLGYTIIYGLLQLLLNSFGEKMFNNIQV